MTRLWTVAAMLLLPLTCWASTPLVCAPVEVPASVQSQKEFTSLVQSVAAYNSCVKNAGPEYAAMQQESQRAMHDRAHAVGNAYLQKHGQLQSWKVALSLSCRAPASRDMKTTAATSAWLYELRQYDACLANESARVQASDMPYKAERLDWLRTAKNAIEPASARAKRYMSSHANTDEFLYFDTLPPLPNFP